MPTVQFEGSVLIHLPKVMGSSDPVPGVSSCELLAGKSALTSILASKWRFFFLSSVLINFFMDGEHATKRNQPPPAQPCIHNGT